MKTKAQLFKAKAKELMPDQNLLQSIPDKVNSFNEIDNLIFSQSEYVGGMASIIIQVLKNE